MAVFTLKLSAIFIQIKRFTNKQVTAEYKQ